MDCAYLSSNYPTKLQSLLKFRKVTVYEVTYLNKCSIWPPLKATTPFVDASVNKRLRQFLPSINDCLLQFGDRREASMLVLVNQLLKCPPPKQRNPPDSRPDCLVATCLAQWKQHCYATSNAQCLWQCEMVHHLVLMSICNDHISHECPVINAVRVTCQLSQLLL